MPKYTPKRIVEIKAALTDLESRKISVTEFAHEQGVAPCTVYFWRRRFGTHQSSRNTKPHAPNTPAKFIEIDRPVRHEPLEITIGPATIRVPTSFDSGELQRLLEIVQEC